ncbi:MAG TPA: hypothetical protein VMP13_03460 [Acidimicrobiia bacterium]|nr:hypothetical protein [Acidimicrobiia bacterium]
MQETIARDIEEIHDRLAEIEDERINLDEGDETRREQLLREERRLELRLGEIEERVADDRGVAEEKAANQADLTRTPRLPDSHDEP